MRPSIVYIVLFAAVGAYFPYIGVYLRSSGLSLEAVGLYASLSAAVGLVAAPAWGVVADQRRSVHRPMLIAGIWSALAAVFLGAARDPFSLGLAVVLLSAGSAGLGPMVDSRTVALMGDDRDRYARARAWGSLSFVVGSLAVGWLIAQSNVTTMFVAYVPLMALSGVAAWLLLSGGDTGPRPARRNPLVALPSILREPTLTLFFVGSVLVWATVGAVTTFVSIHAVALGGDGEVVGLLWSLGALVEIPLMFAFPMLSRRLGPERLVVFGALAFAVRSLGWALAPTPLLLLAVAPLGGFGFAFVYVGTVSYIARAVAPGVRTTALGIFSSATFLMGTILGSLIGGQVAGALRLEGMFAVASAGTVAGALLIWWAVASSRARTSAGRASPTGQSTVPS